MLATVNQQDTLLSGIILEFRQPIKPRLKIPCSYSCSDRITFDFTGILAMSLPTESRTAGVRGKIIGFPVRDSALNVTWF